MPTVRRRLALLAAALGVAALQGCPEKLPKNAATTASARATASPPRRAGPAPPALQSATAIAPQDTATRASELARRFIILDGHIDTPHRLAQTRDRQGRLTHDIATSAPDLRFDYERARRGGLDVPFLAIYVPVKYEGRGAKSYANGLIDLVEQVVRAAPARLALARSPADVRAQVASGRISVALGMENGAPLERRLENVSHFHARGVRYITLAHSRDNHLADSSYDGRRTHRGLSAFGKRAVAEMNRVGVMIDVSHVSDDAFWQILELSRTPVIASHSACRHFTPGWSRNLSDEMIRALAKAGGVLQINFGAMFLDDSVRKAQTARGKQLAAALEKLDPGVSPELREQAKQRFLDEHPLKRATLERAADHVTHAVKLVGARHVGLGSDFDGVDPMAEGLTDVSGYPNLIRVLLERGFSEADIEAICSGNVLRVWQEVEDFAERAGSGL
ncbi:MAG TPA: dipeptidase [Polyangiaceae bacterium]